MKTDPLFLFNYGVSLLLSNECEKSVILLNKSADYRTSYNLYLNIGHANECVHNDSLAELSYRKASFLIPHRFVPRYYLFKLYKRTGQEEKAFTMAKEISDMKIKVYSPYVGKIKKETLEYLIFQHEK